MDAKIYKILRFSTILAVVAFAITATHHSALNAIPTALAQQHPQKLMAKLMGKDDFSKIPNGHPAIEHGPSHTSLVAVVRVRSGL